MVALREIAEKTISPEDLKEDLIHSLQKYVEVDEPEPESVPLIGAGGGTVDADDTEVAVEHMSEEEFLKGLEGLAPPEAPAGAARRGGVNPRGWLDCFASTARPAPGRCHLATPFFRPCGSRAVPVIS